ncbi:MAG: chloride channel protein, partial [Elusimicrobia bacterium]|nr:chloride channel protein [Elusimicrobiota bacterium]
MTPPAPHSPDGAAGLPVAPGLVPLLADAGVLAPRVDRRVVRLSALAMLVAAGASLAARWMLTLIDLCTNISWYGRFSTAHSSPADNELGAWGLLVPVAGGVLVGIMARYGSKAIRGHGIPEAMEQILKNESRIPARVLFLKPLSAAVSIGTGGPFGAEGPIISTGGALGSLVGQFTKITAMERKTLLAAGACAGMTAIFGTPVAAVLLAVELLLFELRPRSLIPVAAAAVTAMGFHAAFAGTAPIFPMPTPEPAAPVALLAYAAVGALVGLAAVGVTRLVYAIEDAFERLPVHWMWWPALGAIVVGAVGLLDRRTLGVGYENISGVLSGGIIGWSLAALMILKFISWSVSLGSGTSGGTLAPLLTIGGALGALLGAGLRLLFPDLPIDPRVAALVGMAAMFAGASRALLTSVVFAFEATRQPLGLVPILGGSAAAYLVSCLTMRHTIMTEKIERRGVRVPSEYAADHLDGVLVRDAASAAVVALAADLTVAEARG